MVRKDGNQQYQVSDGELRCGRGVQRAYARAVEGNGLDSGCRSWYKNIARKGR
ncbi:uncharacterized protein G6M90_00g005940 [Metarhizium brunneum]|uniref:Uncharacterized protein n=1 Tax=Metarhizium brunneum TaxID=500148 RepID=A0A7D5YQU8_9HYPO|nr:hypothetical protein G6M90_00g005940 [Metarhizium brunneum]